ncbi:Uncharacterized protein QTN25_001976 [Entamoeba marina]
MFICFAFFGLILLTFAASPITDDERQLFEDLTDHNRTYFDTDQISFTSMDNFQFAAVPFPENGSTQIYDVTAVDYDTYENTLLFEGYWLIIIGLILVIFAFAWYFARPCLGGVRGTRGCLCPKPFKRAYGEGYSYKEIKRCQIASIFWVILMLVLLIMFLMLNATITAYIRAISDATDTVSDDISRHIRIIQQTFDSIGNDAYESDLSVIMDGLVVIKKESTSSVNEFGDYARQFNKTREGLGLFTAYISIIMLSLFLYATCSFHYQMASGVSIFGWVFAVLFISTALITFPLDIVCADACLLGDKILNSDTFEEQSVVNYFFTINDPSVLELQTLFDTSIRNDVLNDISQFLDDHCGDFIYCNSSLGTSVTSSNYLQFKDFPFRSEDGNLYSCTSCQTACSSSIQTYATEYTTYYSNIDKIDNLLSGSIESLRSGKPFEEYVYSIMDFMCHGDVQDITIASVSLLTVMAVLFLVFSLFSMCAGKRFHLHNKSKTTPEELIFRGTKHQWELANFQEDII